jgi:hypothetical protein
MPPDPKGEFLAHEGVAQDFAAILDKYRGKPAYLGLAMICVLEDGVVYQSGIRGQEEAVILLGEFVRGLTDAADKAGAVELVRRLNRVADFMVRELGLEKRGPMQ